MYSVVHRVMSAIRHSCSVERVKIQHMNAKQRVAEGHNPQGELRDLCENWFNGNVSTTALALGRTESEIEGALAGETVDEDLLMKIRGIKDERRSQA